VALRDLLKAPLDLDQADAQTFMARVQGNILKGHGRLQSAQIFLRFNSEIEAARAWIAGPLSGRLTSAKKQSEQTEAWRQTKGAGEPFFAFFLSYQGYVRLGVADADTPSDIYFRVGMKSAPAGASTTVADPPPSRWEANFRGRIDAMVLAADADRKRLDLTIDDLTRELAPFTEGTFVERGDQLTFDFGGGRDKVNIEHFGHQDGISQPLMVKKEIDEEVAQRGDAQWNPGAPLELAFLPEPGGQDTFGSYLVFRKLAQNVKAFRAARDGLATTLGIGAEDAAALAVGRYRDGRPVLPTTVIQNGADPNDFSFKSDPNAARCPYQAHIRKTNPRGDLAAFVPGQTDDSERALRIVRRGITFGKRPDLDPGSTLPPPASGVGLLFMCYAGRLIQFVIQQDGSDQNDFVRTGVGPDAVLGQNATRLAQQWPLDGTPAAASFLMANFVTMQGGEYFFAPSPVFLRELATKC
jgi:deferrochelatase/peroxidase EfeB